MIIRTISHNLIIYSLETITRLKLFDGIVIGKVETVVYEKKIWLCSNLVRLGSFDNGLSIAVDADRLGAVGKS